MAYTVFAQDFEEKICHYREKARKDGAEWLVNKKIGDVIFLEKEKKKLQEGTFFCFLGTKITLLNIYDAKGSIHKIYRIKIETVYKPENFFKKKLLCLI